MRPDPEELLTRVQQDEARQSRGRLKLFFGAAAGVGKTYAMLSAGRQLQANGVDVVAGYVETHGRAETDALLDGMEALPPKIIPYRGATLREFDLDAALLRKPAVMLVDELAHTNAAGMRHAKRWQDVQELIHAGIDVYSTVNVQHLESLNDLVAQITGVVVRETVPDSVLDEADEVELIDLSPDELLQRLKEGKVYVSEQARHAIQNFFRVGNLIALRELALRRTADRVDAQMRSYRQENVIERTWPVAERLMVCIGPSPFSKQLVRAGKRMASQLRAEWVVACVETSQWPRLPEQVRSRVLESLRLAEQLGAETVTLSGARISDEVLSYARKRNVSKIVIGKPAGPLWRRLLSRSILDELIAGSGEIDIYAIRSQPTEPPPATQERTWHPVAWKQYLLALLIVAVCTIGGLLIFPYTAYASVIMVYLLGVSIVALRAERGPCIFASILSVGSFDFFFTIPYHTFVVTDGHFVVIFVVMLTVALTISGLTVRIKSQARYAVERESRSQALYRMSRALAGTPDRERVLQIAARHTAEVFQSRLALLLPDESGRLVPMQKPAGDFTMDAHETAVAQWVHEHGQKAGRGTTTLPEARAQYLPLAGSGRVLGVMAVDPASDDVFHIPEQSHLLETFANQIAIALERAQMTELAREAEVNAETERMRSALLSAVSHDLRTPLATIIGALSGVLDEGSRLGPATRDELIQSAYAEAEHLSRLVNNLLDMTRLESGGVDLRKEWQPLEEVVGSALRRLERLIDSRPIEVSLPPGLPPVQADGLLLEQLLVNLLENSAKYSPAGSAIEIRAVARQDEIQVEVLDRGPGFVPGEEQRVFEKFYRGNNTSPRGAGIGLTICAAIIAAHHGRIWAENREGGGAVVRFTLPAGDPPPEVPAEMVAAG